MKRKLNISEEEKAIALAKKDRRYFAALYESTFDQVYRFVWRRVRNSDVAGDITSQTYMKAMLYLPKYQFQGVPFVSWLYRIALNETNQFFRKQKRQMEVRLPENLLMDLTQEIEMETSCSFDQLVGVLNSLPLDQVNLIELRFFEKYSFSDIANILGGSEESVKMKLYRLLRKLRKMMEGGLNESF